MNIPHECKPFAVVGVLDELNHEFLLARMSLFSTGPWRATGKARTDARRNRFGGISRLPDDANSIRGKMRRHSLASQRKRSDSLAEFRIHFPEKLGDQGPPMHKRVKAIADGPVEALNQVREEGKVPNEATLAEIVEISKKGMSLRVTQLQV